MAETNNEANTTTTAAAVTTNDGKAERPYKLFHSPSTASMAPHILLEEIGVPYELILTDIKKGDQKDPEYLKLNPNGTVPTLVDGPIVLYETAAICLHLADKHKGWMPPLGSPERAQVYKWLVWLSSSVQATLMVYFYPQRYTSNPDNEADTKLQAQKRVQSLLEQLDRHLEERTREGGDWFFGETFSIVDVYAMMLCRWTRHFDDKKARDYPSISPWLQRVLARPAVKRVFESEKIEEPYV